MDARMINGIELSRFVFVDCESSGLHSGSYPIEIGVGFCSGESLSRLIRPTPEWKASYWDKAAENIHHITQEELEDGYDVLDVAKWFLNIIRRKIVCSDNPKYEAYWVGKLLESAKIYVDVEFVNSYHLIQDLSGGVTEEDTLNIENRMKAYPYRHRAGDDALFWAMAYREFRQEANRRK